MVMIQNPDVFRNYEILEKFDAGIELTGFETKAIFSGKGRLKGAYVSSFKGELYLKNFYIAPYQERNIFKDYNPTRSRRLLLRKKEIKYLINKLKPGFTIIPLKVYNVNKLIKVEIAIAKGLKKYEKREKIKKREFQRQKERILKSQLLK